MNILKAESKLINEILLIIKLANALIGIMPLAFFLANFLSSTVNDFSFIYLCSVLNKQGWSGFCLITLALFLRSQMSFKSAFCMLAYFMLSKISNSDISKDLIAAVLYDKSWNLYSSFS
eukprot:NODE_302_length_11399_cov_0.339115.p11 type:complete len:119 gc:universal NODE_302_length_11399_cov_0.339115:1973-1617(-)